MSKKALNQNTTCVKHGINDQNPDIDKEEQLELQETKLALRLKAVCNNRGEEENIKESSKIFSLLGEIYHKKFSRNTDLTTARFDALRSAALYQAALERSKEWPNMFESSQQKLISLYDAIFCAIDRKNSSKMFESISKKIRNNLQIMRAKLLVEFYQIEYPFKDETESNKESQIKFQSKMEAYQTVVTDSFTHFMSNIFQYCFKIMGEPPCSFAVLGLGSLAKHEVTPFSDFESIVVLQNKIEVDETMMNYFRNYAMLAQLVVIGLGETILPAMSVKTLNDFETDGGDWFVDVVTRRGLSFDGLLPHACKNPLGRLPTANKPWHTELIQTVDNMLSFVDEETELKEGYHLADIISHSVFVAGGDKEGQSSGKAVAATFYNLIRGKNAEKVKSQKNMSKMVDTIRDDIATYSFRNLKHGQAVHVKKDLYRGITILLPQLAMLVGIRENSSYDIVQGLLDKEIIDNDFCVDLKTAVAIANYARAKTYFDKGAQWDALAGGESHPKQSGTDVLETVSISALQHLFCVGTQFQESLSASLDCNCGVSPLKRNERSFSHGSVLFRFEQYDRAIEWFQQQLELVFECKKNNTSVLISYFHLMLGRCYYSKNQHEVACRHFIEAEENCKVENGLERGRILLFRALSERKLKGVDTTHNLMKKAHDYFNMSKSSDSDEYTMESFVAILQHLCKDNSDLMPELIEVRAITGYRLLNDAKAPFLALSQFQNALDEMEKYYKDERHILLKLYVKEAIAVCEGKLGHFDSAVDGWLEFTERSKNMPKQGADKISFKPGYNPMDSLVRNVPDIKMAFCSNKNLSYATEVCCKLVEIIDDWLKRDPSNKLLRFSAMMNDIIGDLYKRDKLYDLAIQHYNVTKFTFSSLYPNSTYAKDEEMFLLTAILDPQKTASFKTTLAMIRRLNQNKTEIKFYLDVLHFLLEEYNVSQNDTLLTKILAIVDLAFGLLTNSNDCRSTTVLLLKLIRSETRKSVNAAILKILAKLISLLCSQTAEDFVKLIEETMAVLCNSKLDRKEFSKFFVLSTEAMIQNFPMFAFNVQTSSEIRNILHDDEIPKTEREELFLRVAVFNRFRQVNDLTNAFKMLKPFPINTNMTILMRKLAAECLTDHGKFSEAILAYNLTLAMMTENANMSRIEKQLLLADVMFGTTLVWILQNQLDLAIISFENALKHMENLGQLDDKDILFDKFNTRLFRIAEEFEARNEHDAILRYRDLLLNGNIFTILKPTNLKELVLFIRFTNSPHDGINKLDRLPEILYKVASSPILTYCTHESSGKDVVDLLLDRIFSIPTELPGDVSLRFLACALDAICKTKVVCSTEIITEKNSWILVSALKEKNPLKDVLLTLLSISTIYVDNDLSSKAEQCLDEGLRLIKGTETSAKDVIVAWFHSAFLTQLSWCCMDMKKPVRAWMHLNTALRISAPNAQNPKFHRKHSAACGFISRNVITWINTASYLMYKVPLPVGV